MSHGKLGPGGVAGVAAEGLGASVNAVVDAMGFAASTSGADAIGTDGEVEPVGDSTNGGLVVVVVHAATITIISGAGRAFGVSFI